MIQTQLPESLVGFLSGLKSHQRETGFPWVTLAYAQSLDGSISAQRGLPLVISGPKSMAITHNLRAIHQAILIGIGTLLADDPQLNVRQVPGEDPQPVVLDNQLRTPLDARLLHGKKPPWIMTSDQSLPGKEKSLIQLGVRVLRPSPGKVILSDVLRVLGREGIGSVMVEGGAGIITAILKARLVDAVVITISPLLVGGLHAIEGNLSGDDSGQQIVSQFPRIVPLGLERLDDDLLVWGRPNWNSEMVG